MKINRNLFREHFEIKHLPEWHCPECNAGKLFTPVNGIKTFEYAASLKNHDHPDWDVNWTTGCFTGILNCTNNKCKNKTVFSGNMFIEPEVEEIDEPPYHIMAASEHITPKYFNPPLEIIPVSEYLKEHIANCLWDSFHLFWIDNSACANKIRIMVEVIMTEQKIPKTFINKKKKRTGYKLHDRIVLFQKKNPEVAELLFAIKWIGNEGSHELDTLKRENVLTAYEILYLCLDKLYNTSHGELTKIAKAINKNKGVKKEKRSKIF